MTKRVIQTDLFAAFKDSQRRAEEKIGQKRKIKVEGTTVRRVDTHTEKGEHGLELIHSKPVETEPATTTATATETTTTTVTATAEAPAPERRTVGATSAAATRTPTPPQSTPRAPQTAADDRPTVSYQEATRKTVTRTRQPLSTPAAAAATAPESAGDAIRVNTPVAATAQPSGDDGGTLLKWATVILLIAAAYIVGERMGEEKATENARPIGYIGEPDVGGDTNKNVGNGETEAANPTPEEDVVEPAPEEETVEPDPIVVEPAVVEPAPLGNKTVLVVSGINKRQAEKVAELVRSKSDYPVYIRNDAVYVGRFEGFFKGDINKCQEFCRNLEFEGRKQFKDAFQIKLPGSLINE